MGRYLAVALSFVFALAFVPGASAATTLYTTPSPASGSNCSAANPCGLATALGNAVGGDTVVIGVGTYQPAAEYEDDGKSLTIAGAAIGTGRPVVKGNFFLSGAASQLRDVEIDADSFNPALILKGGASADRVLAINAEWDGCSIEASGATIANSLCISENPTNSSGMATQESGAGTMAAHNLTLIGYYGYFSNSPAEPGLTMADSMAVTTHPDDEGEDASFNQGMTFATRSYLLRQSSPENVTETEPLTQEPIFRGPSDYREAANSPSIDAGSASAAPGELDLNGNLRKIGAKTDVGAYEFVPTAPSVGATSVSAISASGATVGATVNPNSGQTRYRVEYGATAAHGSSTASQALPAGITASAVHVDLSGLAPGSTVHYSVIAESDGGTTTTADATFETVAAPSPPPFLKRRVGASFADAGGGPPKGQPLLDRPAIALLASCGPLACKATLKGTVTIAGKRFGALPGPKKAVQLKAGKQGTLKVSSTSALRLRVREYLLANPSARAKVKVTATFVAADGSRAKRTLTIPVRPL